MFGAPKVVVLDEPNSNLDGMGDAALARTIQSLKAAGTTVILVSHREELVALADHVAILNSGRLVHVGDARQTQAALEKLVGNMQASKRQQPVPAQTRAA